MDAKKGEVAGLLNSGASTMPSSMRMGSEMNQTVEQIDQKKIDIKNILVKKVGSMLGVPHANNFS